MLLPSSDRNDFTVDDRCTSKASGHCTPSQGQAISAEDARAMLGLARDAIVAAVRYGRLPDGIPTEGIFAERRGVFVTLHVERKLRGCIGLVEGRQPGGVEPLGESVVRCAASAALQDWRFPPIKPEELDTLVMEISLLSPPAPICLEQIEIGRHGLFIVSGQRRGVLLPQVAVEHGLTPEQFLAETCLKAELPVDAWRNSDVQLFGFTCEAFSEEANPEKL